MIVIYLFYYIITHFNRQKILRILEKNTSQKYSFAICIFDEKGEILEKNTQFESFFGQKNRFDELFYKVLEQHHFLVYENENFEFISHKQENNWEVIIFRKYEPI